MFKGIVLNRFFAPTLALAMVLLLTAVPCLALPNAAQVEKAIAKAKVLPPGSNLTVSLTAKKVSIVTKRHQGATDDDCKIDAVLIAKQVMGLYAQNVPMVEVSFLDAADSNQFARATVTAFDINGYGGGAMTRQDLLNAIVLTSGFKTNPLNQFAKDSYKQILQSNWVAPGDLAKERLDLFTRIKAMQGKGLTKELAQGDFTELFRIEDFVRQEKSDSAHKCFSALNNTVKAQESRLN